MLIEEKLLLNELRERNQKVFKELFCEYYPLLVRYAQKYVYDVKECDDIVQNVFISFWENTHRITIETSIKAYLFKSIKNRCLNYLRDLNIRDKHNLLYLESILSDDDAFECMDKETAEKIHLTLEKLPPQMREFFKLKYLQGKKYSEIAQIFKLSENTVKTHIQRARGKLRTYLYEISNLNL